MEDWYEGAYEVNIKEIRRLRGIVDKDRHNSRTLAALVQRVNNAATAEEQSYYERQVVEEVERQLEDMMYETKEIMVDDQKFLAHARKLQANEC